MKSVQSLRRTLCRVLATSAAITLLAGTLSAHADRLAPAWNKARAKWNAVADKAVAGDNAAVISLRRAVEACQDNPKCTHVKSDFKLTQAQIDAAAAAVNIAWMYGNGKNFPKDLQKAFAYNSFAARFLYPVALSNLVTAYSDGTADLGKDKVIAARYFEKAAGLGKADAAINAGDYYAKAGDTVKARHFFGRAIMLNPSTAERARANKHLAALGNTAQPVTPASAPSATDVRSDVISQGFMCIDDSRKISRSSNILFLEQRKLDKHKEYLRRRTAEYNAKSKELESATKKMSDEEIGKYLHATIEIKNQIAEYNSENKQFNMLMQAFKELKDKYNKRCDEMKVTIAEFKQLCSGDNADVDWCKSFN